MKKLIYVEKDRVNGGDEFDGLVTFDKEEAISFAERDWEHLTNSERKTHQISVAAFNVEVNEGESAKAAYTRLLEDDDSSIYNWDVVWESDKEN